MSKNLSSAEKSIQTYLTKVLGVESALIVDPLKLLVLYESDSQPSTAAKAMIDKMLLAIKIPKEHMKLQLMSSSQRTLVMSKAIHVNKIQFILVLSDHPEHRGVPVYRGESLIIETFSPSRLEGHPAEKKVVWEDLQKLMALYQKSNDASHLTANS